MPFMTQLFQYSHSKSRMAHKYTCVYINYATNGMPHNERVNKSIHITQKYLHYDCVSNVNVANPASSSS